MSKFSFEFVTLSVDMEQTLKSAVLPVRRVVSRSIADAMDAPLNGVQAKRMGIAGHMASDRDVVELSPVQKEQSDATTERWVSDVIAIGNFHVLPLKTITTSTNSNSGN